MRLSGLASITLHLVLILWVSASSPRSTPSAPPPIEIEVARESEIEPSRLITTEDMGNRQTPKHTDLYSSHDQTVQKPSRAKTGPEFQGGKTEKTPNLSLSDLGISGGLEGENSLSAATDESLAEIELGQRTLLSAKEYAHWLYFQRIKSLLGPVWRLDIDEKMRSMQLSGRKLAKNESVTQVVVVLDTAGAVRKTTIIESSGSEMLDKSAVAAFLTASPFPNPPVALRRKDGTVSIRWKFIVNQKATRITYSHETSGPNVRNIP